MFEKDIFISYAHIDDLALVEGERGWIAEFHRSLEIRLAQLLGYRPNIWRDRELRGNDDFASEIIDQFPKIACLISILSPRYVKSEWCVREVDAFVKVAEGNIGTQIANKSRIFKVIKTPIPVKEHPPKIQGLLGYEFFNEDQDTGRVKELNPAFGAEIRAAYWARLDDIAHDIAALLEQIKSKESDATAGVAETSAGSGRTVYLAESSSDLQEEQAMMRRFLKEQGYKVLPDKRLSFVADEFIAEVKEMLDKSELSIHMIGANYGIVPESSDGSNDSIVVLQNRLAAEMAAVGNLKKLIWMPPGLSTENEHQASFIDDLQNHTGHLAGADLIKGPLEDLKFVVKDKMVVKEKPSVEQEGDAEIDSGPATVYLVCDERDMDAITPLDDYFFDQGFNVMLPVFEGDPSDIRLDHQENLKTCDAVVLYYGAANEVWLRSKMRDLMKIAGYGRKSPLEVKAVVVGPPDMPSKKRVRSHDMEVISMTDGIAIEKLQQITEQLKRLKA